MRGPWLVGVVLGACQFTAQGLSPGADAMSTADAPQPDAACPAMCDQGNLVSCNGAPLETCALGCFAAAGSSAAHCGVFVPTNGVDLTWTAGTDPVAVTVAWILDPATGEIRTCNTQDNVIRPSGTGLAAGIDFEVVPGANGAPPIGVFAMRSLDVGTDGALVVLGGPNAAALVAAENMDIRGIVAATGGHSACSFTSACAGVVLESEVLCPGAGAGAGGAANSAGSSNGGEAGTATARGAGGGGSAAAGGRGGKQGGLGGTSIATGVTPLVGGGGGGGGRAEASCLEGNSNGGGGGGALQLSAGGFITLRYGTGIGGVASVGAGGSPGYLGCGGGGGGAGGLVVIEAPVVALQNNPWLVAGGGGGASGNCPADNKNEPMCWGATASLQVTRAAGGVAIDGTTAAGGSGGGYTDSAGGPGLALDETGAAGGGGGGARGRIHILTQTGSISGTTVLANPTPTTGTITVR